MQKKAEIKQNNILIMVNYKINNLYHFSKYVVNIALLITNFLNNINAKLTALKPKNNNAPKKVQNGKIINVESTEASPINKKNAKAIAKKPTSLYQQIHKKLKHFNKIKMESLYKFIYKIPKMKQPLNFFCDQCKNNKLIHYIKKY